jgi:hypothetical protein
VNKWWRTIGVPSQPAGSLRLLRCDIPRDARAVIGRLQRPGRVFRLLRWRGGVGIGALVVESLSRRVEPLISKWKRNGNKFPLYLICVGQMLSGCNSWMLVIGNGNYLVFSGLRARGASRNRCWPDHPANKPTHQFSESTQSVVVGRQERY